MITLSKAELHPYRCIETVQTLEFSTPVTTLVGCNEAGKTSILESLAKSNYYTKSDPRFIYNPELDYPRRQKRKLDHLSEAPVATVLTYTVSPKLQEEIREEMLLEPRKNQFTRITSYNGTRTVTNNAFTYNPYVFWKNYTEQVAPNLIPFQRTLAGMRTKEHFAQFCKVTMPRLLEEQDREALTGLGKFFENPHGWENPLNEYVFRTYLLPHIPKFLFYDTNHMLPSRICLDRLYDKTELQPSEYTAQALLSLLDIPIETLLLSEDLPAYRADLEIMQAELTQTFLQAWTGNPNLRIELELCRETAEPERAKGWFPLRKRRKPEEHTYLDLYVKDVQSMVSLPLKSRSKGFRYFFSFWVWFKAIQKRETQPYFLLLDEPNLYLHETAQTDLLHFFDDLSTDYQLLYTTHSPYLTRSGRNNIYVVENGDSGTIIREQNPQP